MGLDQGGTATHAAAVAPTSMRPVIASIARDLVLATAIPLTCYFVAKRWFGATDLRALMAATIFPLMQSVVGLARRRELDPVALIVLLGIVTSASAFVLGGDPRLLLIRESFFTAALGIACLLSLVFMPRPIMFYVGRYFMAGRDSVRRARFDAGWQNPGIRRAHHLITLVWGVVYVSEFVVRAVMVYRLSSAVVLAVSPIVMGVATFATVAWTFRYAARLRARASG